MFTLDPPFHTSFAYSTYCNKYINNNRKLIVVNQHIQQQRASFFGHSQVWRKTCNTISHTKRKECHPYNIQKQIWYPSYLYLEQQWSQSVHFDQLYMFRQPKRFHYSLLKHRSSFSHYLQNLQKYQRLYRFMWISEKLIPSKNRDQDFKLSNCILGKMEFSIFMFCKTYRQSWMFAFHYKLQLQDFCCCLVHSLME